jgi:transcriptional repressor BetI
MEPLRRRAIIDATIAAIGERGSLDVTMTDIAGRAGVSSALAHHYFGGKDDLMFATMRHLLGALAAEGVAALKVARTPRERIDALLAVSFSPAQFRPETVAAWLAFYVEAQRSPALRRLLTIDLMSGLVPLLPRERAHGAAEAIAAMIDGFYIRRALEEGPPDAASAIVLITAYVDAMLGKDSP